jgi:hypothetical protein
MSATFQNSRKVSEIYYYPKLAPEVGLGDFAVKNLNELKPIYPIKSS